MKLSGLFLCVIMSHAVASVHSQTSQYSLSIDQKSLKEAFSIIEKESSYRFLYNDDFVDLKQTVSLHIEDNRIENILDKMLSYTGISYRLMDNNLIVLTPAGLSQQKTMTGKVVDIAGVPIPGVNVVVKGTSTGTTTNIDGEYSLSVPDEQSILVFSFIGYTTQEVLVAGKQKINITMTEDTQLIEEVVVVGYGTQRKKDLTSSVVSVKSDDFIQGAISSNPLQLVEGKIAGLVITRNNGNDPNAGLGIQMRGVSTAEGSTAPLIIIDGVPGGDINTLSPQDIASMDILKDGSAAAIYGTRGTNGVILITTKKGQVGATRVDFEAMLFTETIEKQLESLSSDQYWQFAQDHNKTIVDLGENTNWFDELTSTPLSQMYNLSVSGGTEKFTYRASASYKNQEGITIAKTNRETLNGRISLTQNSWEGRLRFDLNLAYSNIKSEYTSYGAFEQAVLRNPTWPVYNPDGTFYYAPNSSELDYNPVAYLVNRKNGAEFNKFMGDIRASLEIIPGLKASIMAALRKDISLTHFYDPSTSEENTLSGVAGQAERSTGNYTDQTLEATFEYQKQIKEHRFSVMAGYSYQDFMGESFSARNMDFTSDDYLWNNMGKAVI